MRLTRVLQHILCRVHCVMIGLLHGLLVIFGQNTDFTVDNLRYILLMFKVII